MDIYEPDIHRWREVIERFLPGATRLHRHDTTHGQKNRLNRLFGHALRSRGWTFDGTSWNPPTKLIRIMIMEASSNFIEQIKEHFSFLQKEFGFRIDGTSEKEDVALIRYCSERVYVVLFRGPPDFEPGLAFGRLGVDDAPEGYSFEQGDLILLDSCREWKWRKNDCDPFGGLIPELARLLRDCGKRCLEGDESDFVEMKKRRDAAIKKWHSDERDSSIRSRAEIAWQKKDYETVSKLYSTIEIELTDVERTRLSVAQRHMPNES